MSLKYETKPITLPDSVEKIWEILMAQDEQIHFLFQEINELKKRVNKLEAGNSSEEADTKRLS